MKAEHVSTGQDAFDRAVTLLAVRAHTAAELRRKLARRGFPEDSIGDALQRLHDAGYLDDTRFAADFADELKRGGRATRTTAVRRLAARGIPADEARQAVDEAFVDVDEISQARTMAESMVRILGHGASHDRVARRLVQRGFPVRVALDAAHAVLGDARDLRDQDQEAGNQEPDG